MKDVHIEDHVLNQIHVNLNIQKINQDHVQETNINLLHIENDQIQEIENGISDQEAGE